MIELFDVKWSSGCISKKKRKCNSADISQIPINTNPVI